MRILRIFPFAAVVLVGCTSPFDQTTNLGRSILTTVDSTLTQLGNVLQVAIDTVPVTSDTSFLYDIDSIAAITYNPAQQYSIERQAVLTADSIAAQSFWDTTQEVYDSLLAQDTIRAKAYLDSVTQIYNQFLTNNSASRNAFLDSTQKIYDSLFNAGNRRMDSILGLQLNSVLNSGMSGVHVSDTVFVGTRPSTREVALGYLEFAAAGFDVPTVKQGSPVVNVTSAMLVVPKVNGKEVRLKAYAYDQVSYRVPIDTNRLTPSNLLGESSQDTVARFTLGAEQVNAIRNSLRANYLDGKDTASLRLGFVLQRDENTEGGLVSTPGARMGNGPYLVAALETTGVAFSETVYVAASNYTVFDPDTSISWSSLPVSSWAVGRQAAIELDLSDFVTSASQSGAFAATGHLFISAESVLKDTAGGATVYMNYALVPKSQLDPINPISKGVYQTRRTAVTDSSGVFRLPVDEYLNQFIAKAGDADSSRAYLLISLDGGPGKTWARVRWSTSQPVKLEAVLYTRNE